jgi:hypothetical protein
MTITPTDEPLNGISAASWQLGWLLRELGVGVVPTYDSAGDLTLRLTSYDSDVPLRAIAEELVHGISTGWQTADECPVIDEGSSIATHRES